MFKSIRNKIFISFALVLLLNIIATLLFGNYFMSKLYLSNKTTELEQAAFTLATMLEDKDYNLSMDAALAEQIFETEKNNITIMLFQRNENQEPEIVYFSRENNFFRHLPEGPKMNGFSPYTSARILNDAEKIGVFDADINLPLLFIQDSKTHGMSAPNTINYYTKIKENIYLFLMTPQEPIDLAASLAVRYNLVISLFTFIIMALMSYFVSRKITQPIEEIDAFAQRLSKRDFSQECHITTGDELEDLSNNINNMALQLQDYITQLELNQELLEKDLQREAATNKMRKEFIANVSHDFKTPLTLIRAYTETLQNHELSIQEKQEYYQIILTEVEQMNRMVTQLLQISKLENGMVTLENTFFPLDEIIVKILHHNQLTIKNRELNIAYHNHENPIVEGDYFKIEQVLVNLLENAFKYTMPTGSIIIETVALPDSRNYRIQITNTLPDEERLSQEQLDNLFTSFYKADESRSLENQSFGLGLAIVRLTMEMHNQPYGVCYVPEGIQFWFELPGLADILEEDF